MAHATYARLRFFWGLVDGIVQSGAYTPEQEISMGTRAVPPDGVGARRAQLVFTRTPPGTFSEDVAVMHFDFVNFTGGNPDDTWDSGDYTKMDAHVAAWWTATHSLCPGTIILREVRWYRIGTGVPIPNTPEHILPVAVGGSSSNGDLPSQCAASISLHVGPRRNWGRTYFPGLNQGALTGRGMLTNTAADQLATATDTLATTAAADDFVLSVHSTTLGSMLAVEHVAVDNIIDVIRRRRWEHATYMKTIP